MRQLGTWSSCHLTNDFRAIVDWKFIHFLAQRIKYVEDLFLLVKHENLFAKTLIGHLLKLVATLVLCKKIALDHFHFTGDFRTTVDVLEEILVL